MILATFSGCRISKKTTSDTFIFVSGFFFNPAMWYWLGDGWGSKVTTDINKFAEYRHNEIRAADNADYLVIHKSGSVGVTVFPINGVASLGTEYSAPSSWDISNGTGASMRPAQDYVASIGWTSPNTYINAWAFSSSGFGSKVSNPSGLSSFGPGWTATIKYSPNGDAVAVRDNSVLKAWPWSSGAFGTKYSDAASGTSCGGWSSYTTPHWHPDQTFVWLGCDCWAWSSGFGTKQSNPSSGITGGLSTSLHKDKNAIAIGQSVYDWSDSTKYGTKRTDPSNTVGQVMQPLFDPNTGNTLFHVGLSSPGLQAFPWDITNGAGTRYSDPSSPESEVYSISLGKYVA